MIPTIETRPFIFGLAKRGYSLATSTGTWSGTTPMTVRFQWRRCNKYGKRCASITGATASTFRLTSKDVGYRLYAVVTATNIAGSTPASTGLSAIVKR